MAGWKEWLSGEVVEHTELQTYIQDQVVQVYAGTAARSSVIGTALSEGMVSYLEDTNQLQYYDGSTWLTLDTGTDPAIFTAGTVGELLSSNGTAGVVWLAQSSVVAGSASFAGSAGFATNAGTAVYSETSGTAVTISGSIAKTQVTGTAVTTADTATVTNTMLAGSIENAKLVNSVITLNGTAVPLGGSATISGGTAGGFTNPMTTLGDLIVGGTAGAATRLAVGTAGQYLTTNGTTVSWGDVASGSLPSQTGNAGELLITNGTSASWSNTVTANSTAVPAIIAKGLSGQSANLQEWQNSSGSAVARISPDGGITNGDFNSSWYFSANTGGGIYVKNGTSSSIAATIVGTSDQSANLQSWLRGTATVASVSGAGAISATVAEPSANTNTALSVGYVGMPQVALTTGGTTISKAHAGEHIYNTSGGTVTIPANSSVPLEVGTTVVIVNGTASSTIAITTDTLRQAGTTNTGTRTLAAYGMATLVKVASTTWYVSGNGIS